jgi:hypothetical protein
VQALPAEQRFPVLILRPRQISKLLRRSISSMARIQNRTAGSSAPSVDAVDLLIYDTPDAKTDPAASHTEIRPEDLIVYELHVQNYTAQLFALPRALRGTYLGLAQGGPKTPGGLTVGIDHLVELGVGAVGLVPVMQYDKETTTAQGRVNHWGYMTTNFFAPESRYASQQGEEVIELAVGARIWDHQRCVPILEFRLPLGKPAKQPLGAEALFPWLLMPELRPSR